MKWAKYVVALGLGAVKGMTTVVLVGALGQARYTTHIAQARMIPPCCTSGKERYYVKGTTPRTNLLKLAIFFFVYYCYFHPMGTSAYWGLNPRGWAAYTISIPLCS
ncbi:Cationic amino acid transporter 5 [Sesamum angolense]|uniref:Cationic amino acid transporter 5 n=1 Tax=Sesamum angolense TaxID=2727404 RepID=A0AAE1WU14_9LAMI|nr:Cationic amino acid transporter 5 [Sesamum angolense]